MKKKKAGFPCHFKENRLSLCGGDKRDRTADLLNAIQAGFRMIPPKTAFLFEMRLK
ncbi:MAG: hypothetical protein MJ135_07120 [Oscillospiraceae bacterium]|nr:hypothetical protein [Oscillospiraceae bacterium]